MSTCGAEHPEHPEVLCLIPENDSHADHFGKVWATGETYLWDNDAFEGAAPVVGRRHARVPTKEERLAIVRNITQTAWEAPDTSRAAAEAALPESGTKRRAVYDLLTRRPSTDEEISIALEMGMNTVRPRRGELVDMGLVVDSGRRRKTASGHDSIVWTTT